jgi:hypothetical protein
MATAYVRRRPSRRRVEDLPFPGSRIPSAWVALAEAFLEHRDNEVTEAAVYARKFIKAQSATLTMRTQSSGAWLVVGRQRLRARRATQAERASAEPGEPTLGVTGRRITQWDERASLRDVVPGRSTRELESVAPTSTSTPKTRSSDLTAADGSAAS